MNEMSKQWDNGNAADTGNRQMNGDGLTDEAAVPRIIGLSFMAVFRIISTSRAIGA